MGCIFCFSIFFLPLFSGSFFHSPTPQNSFSEDPVSLLNAVVSCSQFPHIQFLSQLIISPLKNFFFSFVQGIWPSSFPGLPCLSSWPLECGRSQGSSLLLFILQLYRFPRWSHSLHGFKPLLYSIDIQIHILNLVPPWPLNSYTQLLRPFGYLTASWQLSVCTWTFNSHLEFTCAKWNVLPCPNLPLLGQRTQRGSSSLARTVEADTDLSLTQPTDQQGLSIAGHVCPLPAIPQTVLVSHSFPFNLSLPQQLK